MVDDSAKSTRTPPGQPLAAPDGTLSAAGERYPSDPDLVLKLLDARLRVGVPEQVTATKDPRPSEWPLEMTPTPMVLDDLPAATSAISTAYRTASDTPREPLSGRAAWHSRGGAGPHGNSVPPEWGDPSGPSEEGSPISYHPPRPPPPSIAPPAPAASFSVAHEYDPRAPTKPKVRRASTVPPPPQLLGLDRMLVWGMVLGGLFVAAVVVLVHKLAPTGGPTRSEDSVASEPLRRGGPNVPQLREPEKPGEVRPGTVVAPDPANSGGATKVNTGTGGVGSTSPSRSTRHSTLTRPKAKSAPATVPSGAFPAAKPPSAPIILIE